MASKSKLVSIGWVACVLISAAVFYGYSVRNVETAVRSADVAVYEYDIVSGPIQPIPLKANLDPSKVELGRRLFNEPRLSRDDTVACSNCHLLKKGGADGLPNSPGIEGILGELNSPTVFNSAFNFKQFWDGRADTLEDQIDGPLANFREMDIQWPEVIRKLEADPTYPTQFAKVYPGGISQDSIKDAIATFERSLITPNGRFDQYLRGDAGALTEREKKGYELFVDLGCVVCHQGVNVGGTLFQKMGKMRDYFGDREITQADLGRFNVTGNERDRFMFKVPGLRNVELTAPYFHDGSVATLEEAVVIMARVQLGYDLSQQEVGLLVDYLKTLTGELPS